MADKKYRLVTRSDFDGLVCAVLLQEMNMLESIKFVHPKDMQDGKVEITENDITTNLPYTSRAHLVFDHHLSETLRLGGPRPKITSLIRTRPRRPGWCMSITAATSVLWASLGK